MLSCIAIQLVTTEKPVNFYMASAIRPVVVPFSVQLLYFFELHWKCPCNQSFLLLLMVCFVYSVTYNIQGAFGIIFIIYSDLRNSLGSVSTMAITTEYG